MSNDSNSDSIRSSFEKKLLKRGLIIERETSVEEPKIVYVKVLSPFNVLCSEAEIYKLRLPVKDEVIQYFSLFFTMGIIF